MNRRGRVCDHDLKTAQQRSSVLAGVVGWRLEGRCAVLPLPSAVLALLLLPSAYSTLDSRLT